MASRVVQHRSAVVICAAALHVPADSQQWLYAHLPRTSYLEISPSFQGLGSGRDKHEAAAGYLEDGSKSIAIFAKAVLLR